MLAFFLSINLPRVQNALMEHIRRLQERQHVPIALLDLIVHQKLLHPSYALQENIHMLTQRRVQTARQDIIVPQDQVILPKTHALQGNFQL